MTEAENTQAQSSIPRSIAYEINQALQSAQGLPGVETSAQKGRAQIARSGTVAQLVFSDFFISPAADLFAVTKLSSKTSC
jgi:hypothetical protein